MPTQLIRGLYNLAPHIARIQGGVVTIGNFDGVHIGHQQLLASVKKKAEQLKVASIVIIFEPQPLEFFAGPKVTTPRLTRFREKFLALQKAGVDFLIVLPFNQELANLSAQDFIDTVLVYYLKPQEIVVGEDFRFGHKRSGNFTYLKDYAAKFGITVQAMPTFFFEQERVSSTRVRQALTENNLALATQLLGRPYSMQGRVRHGDKVGRNLGFPTANIFLHRHLSPVLGIYTVYVHGLSKIPIAGVANIGTRPAIGGTRALLEVHLLDFDQEIYGRYVEIEFCKKLRNEEWYPNLELLKQAISNDVKCAREYFKILNENGNTNDFSKRK